MKRFIAIALLVVMSISLVACGSSKNSLVGTWKDNNGFVFTFYEDGTCTLSNGAGTDKCNWTSTDSKIRLTNDDIGVDEEWSYSISGKTLTVSLGGDSLTLKKQ